MSGLELMRSLVTLLCFPTAFLFSFGLKPIYASFFSIINPVNLKVLSGKCIVEKRQSKGVFATALKWILTKDGNWRKFLAEGRVDTFKNRSNLKFNLLRCFRGNSF